MLTSLTCLAAVVYFESRGEPLEGQFAVAEVVVNRVEHDAFPDTICEVVRQKGQFAAQARNGSAMPEGLDKTTAMGVAALVLLENTSYTKDAQYFHNKSVSPRWAKRFKKTAVIGNHIFYTRDKVKEIRYAKE